MTLDTTVSCMLIFFFISSFCEQFHKLYSFYYFFGLEIKM